MKSVMTLKNLFTAFLLFALFLVLTTPLYAQTTSVPENKETGNITLGEDQTINEDYFAAGNAVTIDGTINGDAYLAGESIFINGTVNGDLLTAGGNVTIRGTITGDVRAAGGNILVTGTIQGNITTLGGNVTFADNAVLSGSLTAAAGNLQVYAPLARGMTLAVGQATLANTIGGNVTAGVGTLKLLDNTNIAGDLTYWSDSQADISQGASVSGELTRNTHQPNVETENKEDLAGGFLLYKIFSFTALLIVGLILIKFSPLLVDKIGLTVSTKIGKSLLVGFIGLILTPIIIIALLITIIGIPIALITGAIFAISLYLSKIFAGYAIGRRLFEYTNRPKIARGWALLAGLIILYVLSLVPVIGWIISALAMLTGFGAILLTKKSFYTTLKDKKLV